MDVRKEVAFFDAFAGHGDYDVLGDQAYRRLLDRFAALVRPRAGERCVDLGCGTGAFTRRLAYFGLDRLGVDVSEKAIQRARTARDGVRYVVADIRRTGLATGVFDVIVYSGVLHHCPDAVTRLEVLEEGFRLLRPGGRAFAFDPSAHSPSMWLYRDPRSPLSSKAGKTPNEVLLRRHDLAEEWLRAGFADIAVHGVSGITFRHIEGRVARLFRPLYNLYEHVLRISPLEDRLGTFLVSRAIRPR